MRRICILGICGRSIRLQYLHVGHRRCVRPPTSAGAGLRSAVTLLSLEDGSPAEGEGRPTLEEGSRSILLGRYYGLHPIVQPTWEQGRHWTIGWRPSQGGWRPKVTNGARTSTIPTCSGHNSQSNGVCFEGWEFCLLTSFDRM